MGLIARLKRITVARIESVLNSVEDPEMLFPQLVKEMEDQVRSATDAEAKAMVAVKAAERDVVQFQGKLERLQRGAELALGKGDDSIARDAVAAQMDLEPQVKAKEDALARIKVALEDAHGARLQIQGQLDELRAKKDEILARARVAKNQQRVAKTVHGPVTSARSILDAVTQLETRVEESESTLEVQREMSQGHGPSLEKRLGDLERTSDVESRLEALKKRVQKAKR